VTHITFDRRDFFYVSLYVSASPRHQTEHILDNEKSWSKLKGEVKEYPYQVVSFIMSIAAPLIRKTLTWRTTDNHRDITLRCIILLSNLIDRRKSRVYISRDFPKVVTVGLKSSTVIVERC
jgi:hypothetical protein